MIKLTPVNPSLKTVQCKVKVSSSFCVHKIQRGLVFLMGNCKHAVQVMWVSVRFRFFGLLPMVA